MLLPGMKPYEIRMIKDTPTGMYLVRHNTYGKYIICDSVNEAATASATQRQPANMTTL